MILVRVFTADTDGVVYTKKYNVTTNYACNNFHPSVLSHITQTQVNPPLCFLEVVLGDAVVLVESPQRFYFLFYDIACRPPFYGFHTLVQQVEVFLEVILVTFFAILCTSNYSL